MDDDSVKCDNSAVGAACLVTMEDAIAAKRHWPDRLYALMTTVLLPAAAAVGGGDGWLVDGIRRLHAACFTNTNQRHNQRLHQQIVDEAERRRRRLRRRHLREEWVEEANTTTTAAAGFTSYMDHLLEAAEDVSDDDESMNDNSNEMEGETATDGAATRVDQLQKKDNTSCRDQLVASDFDEKLRRRQRGSARLITDAGAAAGRRYRPLSTDEVSAACINFLYAGHKTSGE